MHRVGDQGLAGVEALRARCCLSVWTFGGARFPRQSRPVIPALCDLGRGPILTRRLVICGVQWKSWRRLTISRQVRRSLWWPVEILDINRNLLYYLGWGTSLRRLHGSCSFFSKAVWISDAPTRGRGFIPSNGRRRSSFLKKLALCALRQPRGGSCCF